MVKIFWIKNSKQEHFSLSFLKLFEFFQIIINNFLGNAVLFSLHTNLVVALELEKDEGIILMIYGYLLRFVVLIIDQFECFHFIFNFGADLIIFKGFIYFKKKKTKNPLFHYLFCYNFSMIFTPLIL